MNWRNWVPYFLLIVAGLQTLTIFVTATESLNDVINLMVVLLFGFALGVVVVDALYRRARGSSGDGQ